MYLDQWITILKVWFLLQFLSDQNFPDKTEEDFQRFQSDGDFLDSTSDLMPSIVTLTDILDMDIYDVCSNDGKYENGIMAMVFYADRRSGGTLFFSCLSFCPPLSETLTLLITFDSECLSFDISHEYS